MLEVLRKASTPLVAALLVATLFVAYQAANTANATHEPANKGAAAGSDVRPVDDATPILSETMKVSSPEDVIINVSTECAIITELITNNADTSANAFGSVRLWVEIDGRRVPVATDDTTEDDDDVVNDDGDESDIGEVTFCNRAYSRTVTDGENEGGLIDEESDAIHSLAANSFQWLALDTGVVYDDPANGNNILTVELWADYDVVEETNSVADAFVGSRTMIIEPVKVSIHEQVAPQGGVGN